MLPEISNPTKMSLVGFGEGKPEKRWRGHEDCIVCPIRLNLRQYVLHILGRTTRCSGETYCLRKNLYARFCVSSMMTPSAVAR